MTEDLVINSYKEKIKESLVKTKALDAAGFKIIIDELERRGINITIVKNLFEKIKNSKTIEELNSITLEELSNAIEDINNQVTRALIGPIDISDILIRKSKIVASEMSVDGKVFDNDKFVKVGSNLASEINKYGISHGIDLCIKNYTIQKLYQAEYNDKIKEKQKELGIVEEDKKENKSIPTKKMDSRKSKIMKELFNKEILDVTDEFDLLKEKYINSINDTINNLESYK